MSRRDGLQAFMMSIRWFITLYGTEAVMKRLTAYSKDLRMRHFMFSLAACGRYYGGGYQGAPMAAPSDGLLDFVMIKRVSKLKMARLLGEYKSGRYPEPKKFEGLLTVRRGKKMKIESAKPSIVNIDGECLTLSEVTFEVIPRALRLIVNDGKQ